MVSAGLLIVLCMRREEPVDPKKDKDKQARPNTMSYIDFLCWIHKRIQNKFF